MNRKSRRDPEGICFAHFKRAWAIELAHEGWQIVRSRRCRGQEFRREYSIPPYTVDFYRLLLKLVLEVDGDHYQSDKGRQRDQRRDSLLAQLGYQVLRPGEPVEVNGRESRGYRIGGRTREIRL